MYGQDILCGISKGTFEIPHRISCSYIERSDSYVILKFQELLDFCETIHAMQDLKLAHGMMHEDYTKWHVAMMAVTGTT